MREVGSERVKEKEREREEERERKSEREGDKERSLQRLGWGEDQKWIYRS